MRPEILFPGGNIAACSRKSSLPGRLNYVENDAEFSNSSFFFKEFFIRRSS